MSCCGLSATATSLCSRLTNTSAVAASLRSFFSMPCAQNAQTRPSTSISMVAGWDCGGAAAASPAHSSATKVMPLKCFMVNLLIVEHDHGLRLAVGGDAGLDP